MVVVTFLKMFLDGLCYPNPSFLMYIWKFKLLAYHHNLLAYHQDRTKQDQRSNHITSLWLTLGCFSSSVASRKCFTNLSWEILVYFTAAHFVMKHYAMNSLQKFHLCCLCLTTALNGVFLIKCKCTSLTKNITLSYRSKNNCSNQPLRKSEQSVKGPEFEKTPGRPAPVKKGYGS